MTLTAGTRLGHYEIVASIGAGGMGEVYRATDTKLGRDVALKVLPERVAESPELRERFEREARAVASLSHPGILAIYDLGTQGSTAFAVMELLEGETLRDRLATGPLAPRRAVEVALQLARALAAAHDKGVVHRDVKPENVFLTHDGQVKILDFGLARQAPGLLTGSGDDSVSPTMAPGTEPGTVLGTVGYMSPEQVKGQEADARSDIFSFGAVLYEMLTGRRAFRGETGAETMTAILRADPPEMETLTEGIAPALERIVEHCLEKDPSRRFRDAHDLAFALETASGASSRSHAAQALPSTEPSWRRFLPLAWAVGWLVALSIAVQVGRLIEQRLREDRPQAAPPVSFSRLTNLPGPELWPTLSPDGKTLAFVRSTGTGPDANTRLDIFIQRVGGGNAINLTPDSPENDMQPAFSPDGTRIAFRSERDGGGIFLMGSTGESVKRLADFGYNPCWSPDGREVVVSSVEWLDVMSRGTQGELWVIDVASGARRRIATPGDAVQPAWSPDGRRIAYWSVSDAGQRDVFTVPAAGGPVVAVTTDAAVDWDPVWSPDGRQLYFSSDRGGTMSLWRVAIDPASGTLLGAPEPLTVPAAWAGFVSISADGHDLAYVSQDVRTTLMTAALDPVRGGLAGAPAVALRGSLEVRDAAISPDGSEIAFTSQGREDLFVVRADGTGFRQLTDDAFRDRGPSWSRDGKRIAFYSNREGDYQAFTVRPDGSELKRVSAVPGGAWYPVLSPDGSQMSACAGKVAWLIDLRQPLGPKAARRLPAIDESHTFCPYSLSPDGNDLTGSAQAADGRDRGVYVFSLANSRYRRVGDLDGIPSWVDARLLVVGTPSGLVQVVDVHSGAVRHLVDGWAPTVSANGRWLEYIDVSTEADVWMATFDQDGPK
jgi:eukaryotic-like serine/threonine-protein kinase